MRFKRDERDRCISSISIQKTNFINRNESFLDQLQFSTHVRSQFQRKKFLNQTAMVEQMVENVEKQEINKLTSKGTINLTTFFDS